MKKIITAIILIISIPAYAIQEEVFEDWSVWKDSNGKINTIVDQDEFKSFGISCTPTGHLLARIIFPESEKGMTRLKAEDTYPVEYSYTRGSVMPGTIEGYVMKQSGAVVINFTSFEKKEFSDWLIELKNAEDQDSKVIYSVKSPAGGKLHLTFSLNGYLKSMRRMTEMCSS